MEIRLAGNGDVQVIRPDRLQPGVVELLDDLSQLNNADAALVLSCCVVAAMYHAREIPTKEESLERLRPILDNNRKFIPKEIKVYGADEVATWAALARIKIARDYLAPIKGGPATYFRAQLERG